MLGLALLFVGIARLVSAGHVLLLISPISKMRRSPDGRGTDIFGNYRAQFGFPSRTPAALQPHSSRTPAALQPTSLLLERLPIPAPAHALADVTASNGSGP